MNLKIGAFFNAPISIDISFGDAFFINMILNDIILKLFGRRVVFIFRYIVLRRRIPNFKKPNNLTEIIISRILTNKTIHFAEYADKIKVRDYVKSKGLESILLKHYNYWDNANDIKIEELPSKFVLKTNNGEGGHNVIICRDIKNFDLKNAKYKLNLALMRKYKYDYQYNYIKPKILCEELIETDNNSLPTDYKFLCIHGEPVSIFVATERNENGTAKFCSKTIDWMPLDDIRNKLRPNQDIEKPSNLTNMVNIARVLSADFDLVRVDLYEYKNRIYFGELTFSPGGGLFSYTIDAVKKYGMLYNEKK